MVRVRGLELHGCPLDPKSSRLPIPPRAIAVIIKLLHSNVKGL